jgi:hypothetical protein
MDSYAHGRSSLLKDPDSVELSKEEEEVLSSQSYLMFFVGALVTLHFGSLTWYSLAHTL